MIIDEARITRLEALAHLALAPEQRDRMARDLEAILGHMATLSALDTEGVPPYGADTPEAAAGPEANVLREDAAQPSPGPEHILANAPAAKEGQFAAPRSFE
jgi:aspartyl-tRNA(Asn)/glutamyl-tRNA(Gln) amidotransferase subunit C